MGSLDQQISSDLEEFRGSFKTEYTCAACRKQIAEEENKKCLHALGETTKMLAERAGVILKDDYPCNQVSQIVSELLQRNKQIAQEVKEKLKKLAETDYISQPELRYQCVIPMWKWDEFWKEYEL